MRRAGLTALRRGLDAGKVTMADFEAALSETRASVTPEMLEEYERIQETLKSDAVRPLGGIGFVLPGMLRPRADGESRKLGRQPQPRPDDQARSAAPRETANGRFGVDRVERHADRRRGDEADAVGRGDHAGDARPARPAARPATRRR